LIRAENIDEKRWPARLLASMIDGWKNRGLTPEKLPQGEAAQFANSQGGMLYTAYQERLKTLNAADFGDLMLHTLQLLQNNPDVLERYHRYFRYLLVDEYQDTNVAQYMWLRLLAQGSKNICCVGDDDQSIYGWRGAEVGNILKFEQDFPGAKVVRLEQNYRSTPHILAAASGVIEGNKDRLGKTLWTDTAEGEKVRLMGVWDGDEEARWIGEEIEAMQGGSRGQDPVSLDQMAVLVRASHQMRAFEDRFLTIGMPYDAIAYIRVVAQPDDGLAFERIVNTPRRGLGDKAVQEVARVSRERNISLTRAALEIVEAEGLTARARNSLRKLLEDFARWRAIMMDKSSDLAPHELVEMVLDESGALDCRFRDHWRVSGSCQPRDGQCQGIHGRGRVDHDAARCQGVGV